MRLGDSPLKKKQVSIFERGGYFLVLSIVSFLLLFFDLLGVFRPVYNGVAFISAPFQYYASEVRDFVSDFTYTFVSIGSLRDQISNLKRENARLKSKVVSLAKYQKDAESLRDQLNIPQLKDHELVEADIIGGDPSGIVSRFRINKGQSDGVKVGMSVVYQGILVGRIDEVYGTVSLVSFLTDLDSNVIALNERSRHQGIIHGSLDGLVMEDILQREDIKEGDRILTLGDRYPANLLIGSVQKVVSSETSSKKSAVLEPAINYSDLEKVFVVVSYDLEDTSNSTQ